MLLLKVLVKFELVFVTIMGIRKHMAMRLNPEIFSAIFYCGLSVYGKKHCALDLLFGGLTTTPNPQYQRRKIDLCGNHRPNYFLRLVPEVGLFLKVCYRS